MRILFLTHRLPFAPNRGDRIRAYFEIVHLRSQFEVELLSLVHDDEEASHVDDLRRLVASVTSVRVRRTRNLVRSLIALPTSVPLTHTLLDASGLGASIERVVADRPPDVVFAYCSGMARLALEPQLRQYPLVLDMVDVDSAKWAALARSARPPMSWVYAREAHALASFERLATRRAFATLVVSEKERDELQAMVPGVRVEVVRNGVDAETLRPAADPSPNPVVIFCGVMNYPPNIEAVMWLCRDIWPLVKRRRPDAELQVVGSSPTRAVQALTDRAGGIEIVGHVPDVRPYLWRAAVSVAPLRTARGVQSKVLEAVAAGLPTVITPTVRDGLPLEILPACTTERDAEPFASAIASLLNLSPSARRRKASQADVTALSWDRTLAPLSDILASAIPTATSAPLFPRGTS